MRPFRKLFKRGGIIAAVWAALKALWDWLNHASTAQWLYDVVKDWPTYFKYAALILGSTWFPLIVAIGCLATWYQLHRSEIKFASGGAQVLARPKRNRIMSLALFMIVGAGVGAIAWGMRELSFFQAHQSLGNGGDKKEFVASATHVNWFTPREIALAIDRAGPLQKEDVANGFVNGQVDWSLPFFEEHVAKVAAPKPKKKASTTRAK